MPNHADRLLELVRARFDGIDARLAIVESKLDGFLLRLGWLEERAADTGDDIIATRSTIDTIDQRLARIEKHFGRRETEP